LVTITRTGWPDNARPRECAALSWPMRRFLITMAAQSMTMAEFKVDLAQLQNAIQVVSAQAGSIDTNCQDITAAMAVAPQSWVTPSGQTFDELAQACDRQMQALTGLLTEMVQRMQAAYQTYLATEEANTRNLQ
jgi:uncharacterized protein YukE